VNQYVVYYARNWPDALLDRNGADDWPIHYDFAGTFQADDLDGLWALLNWDDRPNAQVGRSMCVGDIAIVAETDGKSGEVCDQMWIARMMGWEKLHRTTHQLVPRVIGVNWPDPLRRETLADEFLER